MTISDEKGPVDFENRTHPHEKPDPWISLERVHWQQRLQTHCQSVHRKCNDSVVDRRESDMLIKSTNATTDKMQHDSTKNIKDVLHELIFWETEMEREINDIIDSTERLKKGKITLENALFSTEVPEAIASDNISVRNHRRGYENVNDNVHYSLLKELDLIKKVQCLLKKTIAQTTEQIERNYSAKQNLEAVNSNKIQTLPLDTEAGNLTSLITNKQFFNGIATQDHLSTPQERIDEVHNAITAVERERMASEQLCVLFTNIIADTTTDLQVQADIVVQCIIRNIDALEEAERQLREKLQGVLTEITLQQVNIRNMHEAIRMKDDPTKLVQTRLHLRHQRPDIDLCHDAAHVSLINEIHKANETIDVLMEQLQMSENSLSALEESQMNLEQDLKLKQHSIFVDKQQVLPRRSQQPSETRRYGRFNNF